MNTTELPLPRTLEIMRRLPYFLGLGNDEISHLAEGARQIALKKKDVLFYEGDPANALYTVISGRIKLAIGHSRNQEKVLDLIERGECCNEIPILLQSPCPTTAQALEDSYVLELKRDALMKALDHNCLLAGKLLSGLCRRMHTLIKDIDSCHMRSSSQRLAIFLLQRRPDAHARRYDVTLTTCKYDLAAILGLSRESLSRSLQQLAKEGIVRVAGRQVRILDVEKLQAYNGWQPVQGSPNQGESEPLNTNPRRAADPAGA